MTSPKAMFAELCHLTLEEQPDYMYFDDVLKKWDVEGLHEDLIIVKKQIIKKAITVYLKKYPTATTTIQWSKLKDILRVEARQKKYLFKLKPWKVIIKTMESEITLQISWKLK
jgi:hypothetical protein